MAGDSPAPLKGNASNASPGRAGENPDRVTLETLRARALAALELVMDEVDRSRGRFTHPSNVSLRKVWPHLFLLFLLFALVLVPPTNATIVVPLSEEALIDDAVAIKDVFKGELPVGEISVRQLGGSFGDLRSWVVGSPQFTLGEKALLFLRADRHGNPRVAHLYQGKFAVSLDLASSEEIATRETPRGVHAGRGFSPGTSPGPGEKETHRLRDLTDRIRHHLSRIPRRPSQHSAALTLTSPLWARRGGSSPTAASQS